jgi:general stress protein CsbA
LELGGSAVSPIYRILLLPNWLVVLNPMVTIDNFVWIVVFLALLLVIAAATAIRYAGGAKRASAMASLRR